jgi:predicted RecA/RadA family phage recombinase
MTKAAFDKIAAGLTDAIEMVKEGAPTLPEPTQEAIEAAQKTYWDDSNDQDDWRMLWTKVLSAAYAIDAPALLAAGKRQGLEMAIETLRAGCPRGDSISALIVKSEITALESLKESGDAKD